MPNRSLVFTLLFSLASSAVFAAEFSAEQIEFFEKQIRPLFVEHCFECHGPDTQEASLRLDSRAAALKGGDTGPAVVPHKPDESELIGAILYDPLGYQMPPDGKLPAKDIEALTKWVEMGAPWPNDGTTGGVDPAESFDLDERANHWSFLPLRYDDPPQVESGWCNNGVDKFQLDKLNEQGLEAAPETDRRTWIRRVYFDVIGLPPMPEQVQAFLDDQNEGAHQRVVEELLASPHYGERWGRHWLDLVRYAESRGHEFDFNVPNPWNYRDYVIRALNADVPYDQFIVEHMAGDLLDDNSFEYYQRRLHPETGGNESILGTGFWYLGEWVHSPVDIRQEEADRFDNMIDVYSKTFLGLTVACARCHDHKFDPIRQKDFYALQGYLQSTNYSLARFETMERNLQIDKKLETLQQQATHDALKNFVEVANANVSEIPGYFKEAQRLLESGAIRDAISQEVVFADFESGTYGDWVAEGDAFGQGPQSLETIADYQGRINAVGQFFINSHQKRDGGRGDDHVGTLTSPEFTIQKNRIHFLVGGGAHKGKTCVNLLVNGNSIRSTTGKNDNQMSPATWDVSDLVGKKARIQIVDNERGGWGNIGADHFVFQDEGIDLDHLAKQIADQATKSNAETLAAWCLHLKEEPTALTSLDLNSLKTKEWESHFTPQDLTTESVGYSGPHTASVELADAKTLGEALQVDLPRIEWDTTWNVLKPKHGPAGEAGSLSSWNREHLLRTPSFEVASGKLWCLVKGGVNTYVAVDSHAVVKGPLHGALTRQHPIQEEWRWIQHDVSPYNGHRAHLEFIPRPGEAFAVSAVVQSPSAPTAPGKFEVPHDANSLQQTFARATEQAQQLFAAKPVESPNELRWVLQHKQLLDWSVVPPNSGSQIFLDYRQLVTEIQPASDLALCMMEGSPENEYVFIRGKWQKRGEEAPRDFLEVFRRGWEEGKPEPVAESGRKALALQMVNADQTPIVPRAIVNRIWQHYFGRGICPTPNDFGHLGQEPTHPELLDWLAVQLVENQWSLKHVHRLILNSSAYRMSSTPTASSKKDVTNQYFHRMNVKRLEGEIIRDAILAVSGRLDPTLFGRSVPVHLTSFMEGRGRPGQSGPVDGEGRRSLYVSVRRNFPDPFFQSFDFPTPHSSIGRRSVSNVPAQALALLNNPLVIEQSRVLADRLLREMPAATMEQRVQWLFERILSRPATESEVSLAQDFVSNGTKEEWASYCHVLLNLKEMIFIR